MENVPCTNEATGLLKEARKIVKSQDSFANTLGGRAKNSSKFQHKKASRPLDQVQMQAKATIKPNLLVGSPIVRMRGGMW